MSTQRRFELNGVMIQLTHMNRREEKDGAPDGVQEYFERDGAAATRRAIVRAAAAIGKEPQP